MQRATWSGGGTGAPPSMLANRSCTWLARSLLACVLLAPLASNVGFHSTVSGLGKLLGNGYAWLNLRSSSRLLHASRCSRARRASSCCASNTRCSSRVRARSSSRASSLRALRASRARRVLRHFHATDRAFLTFLGASGTGFSVSRHTLTSSMIMRISGSLRRSSSTFRSSRVGVSGSLGAVVVSYILGSWDLATAGLVGSIPSCAARRATGFVISFGACSPVVVVVSGSLGRVDTSVFLGSRGEGVTGSLGAVDTSVSSGLCGAGVTVSLGAAAPAHACVGFRSRASFRES